MRHRRNITECCRKDTRFYFCHHICVLGPITFACFINVYFYETRSTTVKVSLLRRNLRTAVIFEHSVAAADAHPLGGTRDDNCGIAFNAVYEIGPLVNTPCPVQTRLWIRLYHTGWQHRRPHVDAGHRSNKRLTRLKTCSKSILVLTQHQRSPTSDCLAGLEAYAVVMQDSVLIELPRAISVRPSHTDVMPLAIISWESCTPVKGKRVLW